MALIPTYVVPPSGAAPTLGNAAAGDTAEIGGGRRLELRNTTASAITVTLAAHAVLVTGAAHPDGVVVVPAAVGAVPGEKRPELLDVYRDPADGYAHLSYSTTTGLTRAVVRS